MATTKQQDQDLDLKSRMTLVTPELATKWLEGKTHNRSVRDSKVAEYAADMKAGKWRASHQGIAFDENDQLIDGQHRLFAVIEANTTVKLMVTRGVPHENMLVIDGGLPRSLTDVIRLQDPNAGVTSLHVAVARSMMISVRQIQQPTRQEVHDFLKKHWDAISFAVTTFGGKRRVGITVAQVVAVVGRAFYTQDKDKLQRFVACLLDGIADPATESAVIKLRNWLMDVRRGQRAIGKMKVQGNTSMVYYGKTARALMGFLNHEKLATLYPATEELFPLPNEAKRRNGRR